ncbi:MerR family transcriptional regulator [Kineosporia sp. J2-2]|uniref:MerR family transcriptional regulator n=1 Tax=Kineosporia corallincola TaxID=2835133 RepID=A0ABS5TQ39_9ACTN|nr:MerR family transcriptional regulator [Kineosporia corallincola]
MSIGAVLELLRQEFPDISISKIRYLEDQGLVEPQRTASGYRKFSPEHVDRLRYVLGMQRDRYLPLRAIREHLDAVDRGLEAPVGRLRAVTADEQPRRRFTRAQLLLAAEIHDETLAALESHGLVSARPAGHFDADAVAVARIAGELAGFGIEPRHLRAFRTAADREAGLIEQVTSPIRHRGDGSVARADDVAQELIALCSRLHTSLLKVALERGQT